MVKILEASSEPLQQKGASVKLGLAEPVQCHPSNGAGPSKEMEMMATV
jgi:hypothetical protein